MTESIFDADKFLHQTTDQAASRRPPLTAGADFIGTIGTPKMRQHQGKKDPSKSYVFLDLPVTIDLTAYPNEPATKAGNDKVTLNHSTIVDFNDTGLDWSPGKNGGLRTVREATGTNVPGHAFMLTGLEGRQIRVKVKHEEYPEGSGEFQDRVQAVAKP